MRILGVDPGSNFTGWGIVSFQNGRLQHIAHGVIKTRLVSEHFFERVYTIFDQLSGIIAEYVPDCAAIEDIFLGKNVNSALKLGQARGSAITAIKHHKLSLEAYSPTQIKTATTGYGRSEKEQVSQMVSMLLNLDKISSSDASDALAIAICHANLSAFNKRVQTSIRSSTCF